MPIRELVQHLHGAFDSDQAMSMLAELTGIDRYQASLGIERAADMVAEAAARAGLRDVEVLRYRGDGRRRWWSFEAPVAWTPRRARLWLGAEPAPARPLLDFPDQPLTLATHSAATPQGGTTAALLLASRIAAGSSCGGRLVVLDHPSCGLAALEAAGALGVVLGPLGRLRGDHQDRVGRVELPAGSRCIAFSVPRSTMATLLEAARHEATVLAQVEVRPAGSMPLVTGRLPGQRPGEVLVQAHLCHPRPGANDNGSGVVALLGLGAALSQVRARQTGAARGLRFLWGPEFTGTAAYLHDLVGSGRFPPPTAVVNLDMVGEHQGRCGTPLVIEREPAHVPGCLSAVAGHCASLLGRARRPGGSGAGAAAGWRWRTAPFAGASDHALFADRRIAVPAIQLSHRPDPYNHSSADTIDKVDPEELRRAAAIAAGVAWQAAVAEHDDCACARRPAPPPAAPAPSDRRDAGDCRHDEVLVRRWPGPFNLRGLATAPAVRLANPGAAGEGARRAQYARTLALAHAIDDASCRHLLIRRAARASGLALEPEASHRFLDALVAAGWAEPVRLGGVR